MKGHSQGRGLGRKSKRIPNSKSRTSMKCFHCLQAGHIRRKYLSRKEKLRNFINVIVASSDDNDASSTLTISINDLGNE